MFILLHFSLKRFIIVYIIICVHMNETFCIIITNSLYTPRKPTYKYHGKAMFSVAKLLLFNYCFYKAYRLFRKLLLTLNNHSTL